MDSEKVVLDEHEMSVRRAWVKEAVANAVLEGYKPIDAHLDQWERYIRGHQTLDQTTNNLQDMVLKEID